MDFLRRLVREAHRRSLWQVLGIYLVGSWIGYQVVLNVMQGFGLPDWVAPFSLVLFLIGLPIVVATAFVQEGLPERRDFERKADPHVLVPGFSTAADEVIAAGQPESRPTPEARRPTPVARHLTWPKAILGGVAAFLVLGFSTAGYMGLRSAGIGPMGSLVGRGELAASDAIVLAQFTGAPGDSVLTGAVTEAFRVDFEQSTIVRLVGPQQMADVLRRMARDAHAPITESLAREIAEREGFKAVLTGEVNPVGSGFVLSARLLAADGRVLASARETALDSGSVLPAIDALSKALRERIGESLRTIRANPPLEQVTTPSLEALRRYTQSLSARDDGDPERAIELLEEAIAADSGFAMAWRKIAAIAGSPGMDPDLRVRAATRAYELRDRLTDRERHLAAAGYYSWVRGDDDGAEREYRSVLELHPDETTALNNLALILTNRRDFAEAEQLLARAVEIGGSLVFFENHAGALYFLGRRDDAMAALERMRELYPDNALSTLIEAALLSGEGNFDAADSVAGDLHRTERNDNLRTGFQYQAIGSLAARGRVREAIALTHAIERTYANEAPSEALFAALVRVDLIGRVLRDTGRARAELNAALRRHPLGAMEPLQRPYAFLVIGSAGMGDEAAARRWITEYRAAVPPEHRVARRPADLSIEVIERVLDGDLGAARATIDELWDIIPCDICGAAQLADAYTRDGDDRSALELYERYLETPYIYRTMEVDYAQLAHTLVASAELYERIGDSEAAARNYARFIELWQDADPELQPRVRAARARLEAIVGRRG